MTASARSWPAPRSSSILCILFIASFVSIARADPADCVSTVTTMQTGPTLGGQVGVFDVYNHRAIVFGGFDGSAFSTQTYSFSDAGAGSWTTLAPTGQIPSAVLNSAAVYDAGRMFLFGGSTSAGQTSNGVWQLTLGVPPTWSSVTTTGTAPSPRSQHSMVLDTARHRLVVFGGNPGGGNSNLSDVWSLTLDGTPTWSQILPTGAGPSARFGQGMTYDPIRDRVLIMGGSNGLGGLFTDIWALNFSGGPAWQQLTYSGTFPSGQRDSGALRAVYEPAQDRVIVCGGASSCVVGCTDDLDPVYELRLSGGLRWNLLTTNATAPVGYAPLLLLDPSADIAVIHGGYTSPACCPYYSSPLNSAYAVTLRSKEPWRLSAATCPSARQSASIVQDSRRNRLVLFGGFDGTSVLGDVWTKTLDGSDTWTPLTVDTPPGAPVARWRHCAVYDSLRDQMILICGARDAAVTAGVSETWVLRFSPTPAWVNLGVGDYTGFPKNPALRTLAAAAWDPIGDRMLIYGGLWLGVDNAILALNPTTNVWTNVSPSSGPLPPVGRLAAGAYVDRTRNRLMLYGGYRRSEPPGGPTVYFNDLWSYSLTGVPVWGSIATNGATPAVGELQNVVQDAAHDQALVFGGMNANTGVSINDAWILSHATNTWRLMLASACRPAARSWAAAAVASPTNLTNVFGGTDGSQLLGDTWTLSIPDVTPPSTISDFSGGLDACTFAVFNWTAPGDNGTRGTATTYDLRRSRSTITTANWLSAEPLGTFPPSAAGTPQSFSIDLGPCSGNWLFAIRAFDAVGNYGDISANVQVGTPCHSCDDMLLAGNVDIEPKLTVYPDPVRKNDGDLQFLIWTGGSSGSYELLLTDVAGRAVGRWSGTAIPSKQIQVSLAPGDRLRAGLHGGVYYARLRFAGRTLRKAVVLVQ